MEDESGYARCSYDAMGNASENCRTFALAAEDNTYTFIMNSRVSAFAMRNTHFSLLFRKTAIFAVEKDLFAMKATTIERGFEIPILTASELQIRWNGRRLENIL